MLHGEPIRYAGIELLPVDPEEGMPASGTTDADGYFLLYTYGGDQADGAVPGKYSVMLEFAGGLPMGGVKKGEVGPTELPADIGEVTIVIGPAGGDIEISIP
jgi:hypothetical protein